jgi:hypothetical protein
MMRRTCVDFCGNFCIKSADASSRPALVHRWSISGSTSGFSGWVPPQKVVGLRTGVGIDFAKSVSYAC